MPLQVTGLRETLAELEQLRARARDLRPALAPSAAEAKELIDRARASRRSPAGVAWPPLDETSDASGELDGAHSVIAEETGLRFVVPLRHASFQFFGTRRSPARNPLPFERVGGRYVLSTSGEAGRWLARMLERVRAYLGGGGAR
jgi:hypothetical protein